MDTAPRSDQPRANRDPAEIERKLSLLHASHVAPLTEFVEQLRKSHFGALVPYFDPTEAGVGATMLCFFEAPGPKAAPPNGSGFVSCDNNDQTAQNMWTLLNEAGVDRASEYVAWNVVPWYVGDGKKIRAVRADDLRDAREATEELLALLPRVRTVVLFGKAAVRAWKSVGTMEAIEAPHPSPLNVNTRPAAKKEIRDALIEARARSRT